jgi:hypothetical protein
MTVIFVILLFAFFIGIDYIRKARSVNRGTIRHSIPGYEALGTCACDGGKPKK